MHCPSLPEPLTEVWDSFAVLESHGSTYRTCLVESSDTLCPYAKIELVDKVSLDEAYEDQSQPLYYYNDVPEVDQFTYNITMTQNSSAIGDISISLSYSGVINSVKV